LCELCHATAGFRDAAQSEQQNGGLAILKARLQIKQHLTRWKR
jgi:hypothetical protein